MPAPEDIDIDWVVSELVKLATEDESRDRLKALELLGRHVGMWPGRAEAAPGETLSGFVSESYHKGKGGGE